MMTVLIWLNVGFAPLKWSFGFVEDDGDLDCVWKWCLCFCFELVEFVLPGCERVFEVVGIECWLLEVV